MSNQLEQLMPRIVSRGLLKFRETEIGRAHVRTPVTEKSRMPSSA